VERTGNLRGGNFRSREVGRGRPGGKGWIGLGRPALWASKRREVLTCASISTRADSPGKRLGSGRDLGLPKGPL
jgi:hypothetical protein